VHTDWHHDIQSPNARIFGTRITVNSACARASARAPSPAMPWALGTVLVPWRRGGGALEQGPGEVPWTGTPAPGCPGPAHPHAPARFPQSSAARNPAAHGGAPVAGQWRGWQRESARPGRRALTRESCGYKQTSYQGYDLSLQKEDGEWTLVNRSPAAMAENHERGGRISTAKRRRRGSPGASRPPDNSVQRAGGRRAPECVYFPIIQANIYGGGDSAQHGGTT
jgi:hypothetical protein